MSGTGDVRRRGSALVLALIVCFIVAGLAFSLAITGRTESLVARNEEAGAQALYAAEAGARIVKGWFDRPGRAPGFPLDTDVVVRQRQILDEDDPYGAGAAIPGPEYKENIDADGDGVDDLFRWPFRGAAVHSLLGTEDAPDMLIEDPDFLDRLSGVAFGDFPDRQAGVRARIERVAIYAPPYVKTADGWVRQGMATLRVTAEIHRDVPGGSRIRSAMRIVTWVLNEIPYASAALGVVHSCGDLRLTGRLPVHWGTAFAGGDVVTPSGLEVPPSFPRSVPENAADDPLWTNDPAWLAEFGVKVDPTEPVPDPWLRLVARGRIHATSSTAGQPFAGPPPPQPGQPSPWPCCDASNVLQFQQVVECPRYDYEQWKGIAVSGEIRQRYFRFSPPNGFREDGIGPVTTFGEVFANAGGEENIYFFDTRDGRAPHDDDADGTYDNLTPEILVSGDWNARGFVYVNAERLTTVGLTGGVAVALRAPGEPSVADGQAWIDLAYPTAPLSSFTTGGDGQWTSRGPDIAANVAFRGVLYTSGIFESGPGGEYHGSVIAHGKIVLDGASTPGPGFFRDASLANSWPPADWNLPRTTISGVFIEP